MHRSLAASMMLFAVMAAGQAPAPFISPGGRLMLFAEGRFLEVDPRAPQELDMAREVVLFVDPASVLHSVEQGQVRHLDEGPGIQLVGHGDALSWRKSGTLKMLSKGEPVTLTTDVGVMTVTDSLLAFHDRTEKALRVWWKGRLLEMTGLDSTGPAAPWAQGSNTLVYHDPSAEQVILFHSGMKQVLFDSTTMALAAPGGGLVAYWDDRRTTFRVWDRGQRHDLEPMRPQAFKAGDGMVAYISAGGALKAYRAGRLHLLLDHGPTEHWVRDSLLVVVDAGKTWVEHDGRLVELEPYVPERWEVHGGTITYFDLDRGVRQWRAGQRTVLAEGMATDRFEVWGEVVVWTGTDGVVRCWWRGRTYEF
jgi:hypothetical protein